MQKIALIIRRIILIILNVALMVGCSVVIYYVSIYEPEIN